MHVKNTFASETPVTDGERVYAYFGNIGLFCYDMEGKRLWSTNWPPVKTRNGWGSAASPVLHGDKIFIVNDNDEKSFAVALDSQNRPPVVARGARGEKQLGHALHLAERAAHRVGHARLEEGFVPMISMASFSGNWAGCPPIVIPTPFSKFGLLYVCSGYVGDKVRPVFAIKPGGSGDISLKPGETSNEFIAWSDGTAGPYNPSPLLYGDYLYVLFDFGFISCHDARTGKVIYDKHASARSTDWPSLPRPGRRMERFLR
jgi:hypothetical protein